MGGITNKAALPRDNDVEKLYQVTARHVVLIFNCFKGFGQLSPRNQQAIVDNFLLDLIEKEGWKNEVVELAGFKKSLERYAILSYVEGQFMVNDKTDEAKELIR